MDELFTRAGAGVSYGVLHRRRRGTLRVIRSPWRRAGGWSPEEAAAELHKRRAELVGQLRRRSESRGIPPAAQEEIVDDAITAVVMSPRGVANEHHLLGAFWLAVHHRCRRYREGRHFTRLGSRTRVEFDTAVEHATTDVANPFDRLQLRDRFARAADLMADLNLRERQVVSVMAIYGVGPVPAARHLRLPLDEVRSAARSADAKLDRVAVIAAAGRMCDYRYNAIAARAAGEASDDDARLARAHVNACLRCGRVYRKLRREMRGREFQRAAAAAFLPMPAASFAHAGGLGRLAAWIQERIPGLPHGTGERAAEALGGAGLAKAAATGTAIVVAGSALTGHIVHVIAGAHAPAHHHGARGAQQSYEPVSLAREWANPATALASSTHTSSSTTHPARTSPTMHHSLPPPPSKSLGYLALGTSASTSRSSSTSHESSSPEPSAQAASVTNTPTGSENAPPSPQSAAPPTQSGGGTDLGYLGRQ
jgi:DNA-directed RNA polymerase specialized sigma24 family protein